ncbi:hypothetical protein C8R46DRAFT_1255648 [Mycena filopes]|nr:hypothetical protein C8R46DRAFT_1255648 [Mycena filopes]
MHRGPSPIFDVPEFPALRRVKPLPKRRRTAGSGSDDGDDADALPPLAALGLPFPLPGPDATAEELIAHAESLSAHMALQSYYMPGLQDIFSRSAELANGNGTSGTYGDGGDDGEDGDDDGMEHLQQPGNTKKRKVPANASASPGHDTGDPHSGGEDDPGDRGPPGGRTDDRDAATVDVYQPPSGSPWAGLGIRKGRPPRITLAGLQHKETLKSRKRQLAAVLGALSHGDTLALDQALSASYPFVTPGFDSSGNGNSAAATPPRVRLSRRLGPRLARAARYSEKYRHPDKRAFLSCAFTFACPSSTADRLVATKEEVAVLRARFEAELARQAAKAAKLAAANKLMAALPTTAAGAKGSSTTKKRGTRTAPRSSRTTATSTNPSSTTTTTPSSNGTAPPPGDANANGNGDLGMGGVKPRGGKKKKRSALANASNPHHLRNYVPSRLPHSDGPAAGGAPHNNNANAQGGGLGPLPLRFLSADIAPRRKGRKKGAGATGGEWICAFCEYDLFYGDDARHRRAVRSRKKILRRRRRARERAARAASGGGHSGGGHGGHGGHGNSALRGREERKGEEEYEWRGEPGGGRERAGELGAVG